jgi:hypothetical protein
MLILGCIRIIEVSLIFLRRSSDEFTALKGKLFSVISGIFLFLYFLVSLAPVTNADSLHYHIGVAIELINFGHFPVCQEWFHCRLAGSGEILNAFGLLFGAEQFGSLLQFSGLLSIFGIARFYDAGTESKIDQYMGFIILISPVLLFLVPSSKPQLYPIAMTTLAFVLVFEIEKTKSKKNSTLLFIVVLSLLMIALTAKFSFVLSFILLGFLAFYSFSKKSSLSLTMNWIFILSLLILLPFFLFKFKAYSPNFIDLFSNPFPGDFAGKGLFLAFLSTYSDSTYPWPISLLVPNSLGGISTILGFGIFIPFLLNLNFVRRNLLQFFMILTYILTAIFVGQSSSRFYLEPFIWLIILTKVSVKEETRITAFNNRKLLFISLCKFLFSIQTIIMFVSLLVGVYTLSPGILSKELREEVMNRTANGYDLFFQLRNQLPMNAVVISNSLSTKSLSTYRSVALDWNSYVDRNDYELKEYLEVIKIQKVTHAVFPSGKSNFDNCFGNIIYKGTSHSANRNPFNANSTYTFYVAELKSELLPECYTFPKSRD